MFKMITFYFIEKINGGQCFKLGIRKKNAGVGWVFLKISGKNISYLRKFYILKESSFDAQTIGIYIISKIFLLFF